MIQPAGAVKSRLHRARELIREYLICPDGPESQVPMDKKKTSKFLS
jgi:hypothetical protein